MKPLKLSVLDLVPVFDNQDDTYALERAVELAQTADELGYTRYWVAEHHGMPQLACPSPEVLLAHIGARTKRIRIGSGALLLPHYKPLKAAESFRLLASLYPGRIDLGIGRAPGGDAHVSMALSGNFIENVSQMPDKLKDISSMLQGSYTYEGAPVIVRPNPSIQPEVWLLGTNKKSAEYAAAFGMGYVFGQFMSDTDAGEVLHTYRELFVPSPLCPKPRAIITIGVVCTDTDEEAKAIVRTGQSLVAKPTPGGDPDPNSKHQLLVGTAESIISTLYELSETHEVDEFMLVATATDYGQRLRSYERLAQYLS